MKGKRALLISSISLLATSAVAIAQASPTYGDASLTVDQQVHLADESHIFHGGDLWLWGDAANGNLSLGTRALRSNTTGMGNVAMGKEALQYNTVGGRNVAVGERALHSHSAGFDNVAIGYTALYNSSDGSANIAVGPFALQATTSGQNNVGVGYGALWQNVYGFNNIGIGTFGGNGITGSDNVMIQATGNYSDNNTLRIGQATGTGDFEINRAFISGIRGTTTGAADAIAVVVDSNGQLGTVSSSQRLKETIADMGATSERLLALRPVTFRFKEAYANGEKPIQFGLIAEEVAEVFPELVATDAEGRPESVKYRLLSTLLLNELKKQHHQNRMQWWFLGLALIGVVANIVRSQFG